MSEVNRNRLKELAKRPYNNLCADCDHPNPDWASVTIGVFLCAECALIHRGLGSHISSAKSFDYDNWDQESLTAMEQYGNELAKEHYEKHVPPYYRRPSHDDPNVLREQWIRAKYERKEFMHQVDTVYSRGYMEGFLMKKGKKDKKVERRKFVLSEVDQTLKYYVKSSSKTPKAVINIPDLNATFCDPIKLKTIKSPNALQLTYLKDGNTRSIYVYADDGKEIIDWYMAIRAAKYQHLQVSYPTCPPVELLPLLTRDFLKEGLLWKTGPKVGDSYKKRWFTLDHRKLMYLEDPLDPFPKGEIYLGEKGKQFAISSGIPAPLKQHMYGFILKTPERTWLFSADTEEERKHWISAISSVLETPETPQDCQVYLRHNLRNSASYKKSRSSTGSHRNSGSSFTGTLRKGKNFLSFS
ncbi:arf-GAP with dual PH domain-containing protein 1-like [Panonychus citri]|uniref:arf-GAP with dual PH domain-containing protein 1-like n=1 Tax=Panonychus citri TaxID=50023 RepID=UPI002308191C|nr:arf-GAP with dual PH domain-containing protein 1-like [Panonychus citri]